MSSSKNKPPKTKCDRCKIDFPRREYLTCSLCKRTLDLGCANVPFVRFNIMDAERKMKWKCDSCLSKPGPSKATSPLVPVQASTIQEKSNISQNELNENDYVTKRNVKNRLHVSSEDLLQSLTEDCTSNASSTLLEDTPNSLPNISIDEDSELKEEILLLKTQLASAHAEIERLNLQVIDLKKKIDSQQKKSNVFKQLLSKQTPRKCTPLKATNKFKATRTVSHQFSLASTAERFPHNRSEPDKILLKEDFNLTGNETPKTSITSVQSNRGIFSKEERHRIIIIGDQVSRNMAISLLQLRSKYRNPKKYTITGRVYPNANIEHAIESSKTMLEDLQEDDWLILCFGSNDSNPMKLGVELSALLKKQNKPKIIVTSVIQNPYLNVKRLNQHVQSLLNCFTKNVHYVDLSNDYRFAYPYNIFNEINKKIDSIDYEKYYLCKASRQVAKVVGTGSISQKNKIAPKQGTIPYYFGEICKSKKSCIDTDKLNLKPPKGTIPYYFSSIKRKVCTQKDPDKLFR